MAERIDHAEKAREELQGWDMSDAEAPISLAAAQVHATLAVVEQQRIANLIAVYGAEGSTEAGFVSKGVSFSYVGDQIREGLGL